MVFCPDRHSITLVYLDLMLVLPRFYSSISLVLHVFYAGSTHLFSGQNLSSMEINPSKFSRFEFVVVMHRFKPVHYNKKTRGFYLEN